jgi:hypothetical protein
MCIDGDDPLNKLAMTSEGKLNAAVEASIELMKQELLKVHETSNRVASFRDESEKEKECDIGRYLIRKMLSCSLAEFREGLASRIGRSSHFTLPVVHCCVCILQIVF